MFTVIGADWCHGCRAIRKKLTSLNMEYDFVKIPPGKAGWDFVEKLTGRRAVPAVFYRFKTLKEFNAAIDNLNITPRELTEEELDDIDD
jgi:glutaredoxin